jgi:hypothetical protein
VNEKLEKESNHLLLNQCKYPSIIFMSSSDRELLGLLVKSSGLLGMELST